MTSAPTLRQTRLDIGGMDCADCARTLERHITGTPGVASCSVQFGTGSALIEFDPAQVATGNIANRIQQLGYTANVPAASTGAWTFDVAGMDCADCARTLEDSIATLAGVQRADVSFATARMRVEANHGSVSPAAVISAVEGLGYRARLAQAAPAHETRHGISRRTIEIGIATTLAAGGLMANAFLDAGWAAPILHVASAGIAGHPVARAARASIQVRRADMNLLMTIAALGALALQDWAEASSLMVLFAIGLQLQSATIDRTRGAIRELMTIAPAVARVIRDGAVETVPVELVQAEEIVDVLPGERVPIDGIIVAGQSNVDQSAITGESLPITVEPGAGVISGSINGDGRITVRATSPGTDTTVSRIIHLVEMAHESRAPVQALVERFAAIYTPIVIVGAAALALIGLLATGGDREWIYRGLILLVVACPCALVISTPVAFVSALGRASRMGVLFKGGSAIEALASIRQLAFDKTGTLTHGRAEVVGVDVWNGQSADSLLALAAAVEVGSTHPVARGIVRAADGMLLPEVGGIEARPGVGAVGALNGSQIQVGRASLFDIEPGGSARASGRSVTATEVYVGRDGTAEGVIWLADSLRPSAPATVRKIRELGVHPFVLSGDSEVVAAAIGLQAGIDDIRAGLLPADKARLISEADRQSPVAMVGDGINDAPALAAARVGIAMGAGGSAVAIEAADIALMGDDLAQLPRAIGLARSTRRIVQENIAFALASKVVFLGLTVGGYTSLWLAVAADVGASLLVTLNALRLLRERD